MYFLIVGTDAEGSAEKREALRARHVAYWLSLGDQVKLGGPLLDAPGPDARPRASVLLVEAPNESLAHSVATADPFWTDRVFATVTVSPMRVTLGAWLPD